MSYKCVIIEPKPSRKLKSYRRTITYAIVQGFTKDKRGAIVPNGITCAVPIRITTNRERKQTSKRGRAWCRYCDRARVYDGERCPMCGRRGPTKQLKKFNPS